jgi:hypothetical protein
MAVLFTHWAGLDVHKKRSTACRIRPEPTGPEVEGVAEGQPFGTFPLELWALADWLAEAGGTHVALERTGAYWQPVSNWLAGTSTVLWVHAAPVKKGPGRQTDTAAARGLATWRR